ncbi:MAG: nuclear transport factor 2 family protein [Pyrinomonadaceae bacterium]
MKKIVFSFAYILTAAMSGFGQCSDTDKKALETFDLAWEAAGQRGDRSYLETTFADDFVALPEMINKTRTIDNILRRAARNKLNPQTADSVISDNYIISCTQNTATITHRLLVTVKFAGGREETYYNRSVHVLEKRGGRWLAVTNANHEVSDYAIMNYMKRDWNNALVKRDSAWFERNFAGDASSIDIRTGAVQNKPQAIAMIKSNKDKFESAELSEMDIRVEGGSAIITGINHVKGRDENGKTFDHRVRFTDTFVKRDGRWQIWAGMSTRSP